MESRHEESEGQDAATAFHACAAIGKQLADLPEKEELRIGRGFKTHAEKIALIRKMMFGDPPDWVQDGETPPAPADRTGAGAGTGDESG
jgi:hypothetical protein